jgi:transcriptional regulator with XRE-family HTH domain
VAGVIRLARADAAAYAIAAMRMNARRTRRSVADAVDMSEQQYGRYELGGRTPGVANLIRIADALGYDLALIPREDA